MKKLLMSVVIVGTFIVTNAHADIWGNLFKGMTGEQTSTVEKKAEVKAPTETDLIEALIEKDVEFQKALGAAEARAKAHLAAQNAKAKKEAEELAAARAKVAAAAQNPAPTNDTTKAVASVGGNAIKNLAKGALGKALSGSEVGGAVSGVASKGLDSILGGLGDLF